MLTAMRGRHRAEIRPRWKSSSATGVHAVWGPPPRRDWRQAAWRHFNSRGQLPNLRILTGVDITPVPSSIPVHRPRDRRGDQARRSATTSRSITASLLGSGWRNAIPPSMTRVIIGAGAKVSVPSRSAETAGSRQYAVVVKPVPAERGGGQVPEAGHRPKAQSRRPV